MFILTFPAYAERSIYEIKTRPGVTTKILLQTTKEPAKGLMLLFPGSHGNGHFSKDGDRIRLGANFLVRSSQLFTESGFATAIIDVPSDQTSGMSDRFRKSEEHSIDIQKIMEFLKNKKYKDYYLVGTSRGTISAAYLATVIKDPAVRGLVMTATMGSRQYAGAVAVEKITLPTLFVHHRDDGCGVSQIGDALEMKKQLINSARVDFVEIEGGVSSENAHRMSGKHSMTGPNPCSAGSHHGFIGVEAETVSVITDWISGKPLATKAGK
jgi:hypothetical protein